MATVECTLPLPRGLQEEIMLKLLVRDLCSSRLVCKLWSRILRTKTFLKRYAANSTEYWLLVMLARTRFVMAAEPENHRGPRVGLFRKDGGFWVPETQASTIVASSGGLLLHYDAMTKKYTVTNPLTKLKRNLPMLVLAKDEMVVYKDMYYTGTGCYRVVVVGLKQTDDPSDHFYHLEMQENEMSKKWKESGFKLPEDCYKKPLMHVYRSETSSWVNVNDFPSDLRLPNFVMESAGSHVICKEIVYMFISDDRDCMHGKIARFDLEAMSWLPMLTVPDGQHDKLSLVQVSGEVKLLARKGSKMFLMELTEQSKWEIMDELPGLQRLVPEDEYMRRLLYTWGYEGMVGLARVVAEGTDEQAIHDSTMEVYAYNRSKKLYFRVDWAPFPFGMFVTEVADLMGIGFRPSLLAVP